ncbi:flagellar biosynthesis protein FlaG [Enterococcus casseliflavus]|uniref:flagellar protein FlaG n=1 Tax=Enterococcus innesii TaxID=2839759 RepID=UPI0009BF8B56|nr:flagellar protein FlaG [Enterococcus innesii]MCO5495264.1 flagellar protein FlaG [Enterococcus innesii]OQO88887.1 flagellar biosynthesis protein FlaG [Enterococcus casseliflavus]
MDIQPMSGIHPIEAVASVAKTRPIESLDQETANLQPQQQEGKLAEKKERTGATEPPIHYFSVADQHKIAASVAEVNQRLLGKDMKLAYEVHERTGRTMVRLVDMQTNEVIKEIPPANMLDVIGKIWDDMGIAVDRKG